MNDFDPCPHCGKKPARKNGEVYPVCECYEHPYADTFSAEIWQRRPIEDALRAELAALRKREKALSVAVAEITDHRLHQSKEINRLTKVESDLVNQIAILRSEKPCDLYYAEMIASLLRELAAMKAANRWIPVEKSYPPTWKAVQAFSEKQRSFGPYRDFWSGNQWGNQEGGLTATHWCPLPEPPMEPGEVAK